MSISTVIGYFLYLFVHTGDPVAWFTAERAGWHRHFTLPRLSGLATLAAATNPHASFALRAQSILELVFAVISIDGALVLARRRQWGAVVLMGTTVASLMTSTTFLSLSREDVFLFPLPILIASFRDPPGRRWIFRGAFTLGLGLLVFTTHQIVLGSWAQ